MKELPAHEKTYQTFSAFMMFGIAFVGTFLIATAIFLT